MAAVIHRMVAWPTMPLLPVARRSGSPGGRWLASQTGTGPVRSIARGGRGSRRRRARDVRTRHFGASSARAAARLGRGSNPPRVRCDRGVRSARRPEGRRAPPVRRRDGKVDELARELVQVGNAPGGPNAKQLAPELVVLELRDQQHMRTCSLTVRGTSHARRRDSGDGGSDRGPRCRGAISRVAR